MPLYIVGLYDGFTSEERVLCDEVSGSNGFPHH